MNPFCFYIFHRWLKNNGEGIQSATSLICSNYSLPLDLSNGFNFHSQRGFNLPSFPDRIHWKRRRITPTASNTEKRSHAITPKASFRKKEYSGAAPKTSNAEKGGRGITPTPSNYEKGSRWLLIMRCLQEKWLLNHLIRRSPEEKRGIII